jgi:hypothetical protein
MYPPGIYRGSIPSASAGGGNPRRVPTGYIPRVYTVGMRRRWKPAACTHGYIPRVYTVGMRRRWKPAARTHAPSRSGATGKLRTRSGACLRGPPTSHVGRVPAGFRTRDAAIAEEDGRPATGRVRGCVRRPTIVTRLGAQRSGRSRGRRLRRPPRSESATPLPGEDPVRTATTVRRRRRRRRRTAAAPPPAPGGGRSPPPLRRDAGRGVFAPTRRAAGEASPGPSHGGGRGATRKRPEITTGRLVRGGPASPERAATGAGEA